MKTETRTASVDIDELVSWTTDYESFADMLKEQIADSADEDEFDRTTVKSLRMVRVDHSSAEPMLEFDVVVEIAEHEHDFGPFEHTRITGTPVRRCSGCSVVSLDGDEDEEGS